MERMQNRSGGGKKNISSFVPVSCLQGTANYNPSLWQGEERFVFTLFLLCCRVFFVVVLFLVSVSGQTGASPSVSPSVRLSVCLSVW